LLKSSIVAVDAGYGLKSRGGLTKSFFASSFLYALFASSCLARFFVEVSCF
jgi:hypothetical protein